MAKPLGGGSTTVKGAAAGVAVPSPLIVRIPGPPCAQGRPRLTTVGGRARAYDPKKSRMWKRAAKSLLHYEAVGKWPTATGPVQVLIVAVSPCPEGDKRKRSVTPRRWATKRTGDADNIAKAVLDAGTDAGLWLDDCQVVRLIVERWVAAQGEGPSVLIEVRSLGRGEG